MKSLVALIAVIALATQASPVGGPEQAIAVAVVYLILCGSMAS